MYIQCLAMYSLFALMGTPLLSYPQSGDAIASKKNLNTDMNLLNFYRHTVLVLNDIVND